MEENPSEQFTLGFRRKVLRSGELRRSQWSAVLKHPLRLGRNAPQSMQPDTRRPAIRTVHAIVGSELLVVSPESLEVIAHCKEDTVLILDIKYPFRFIHLTWSDVQLSLRLRKFLSEVPFSTLSAYLCLTTLSVFDPSYWYGENRHSRAYCYCLPCRKWLRLQSTTESRRYLLRSRIQECIRCREATFRKARSSS